LSISRIDRKGRIVIPKKIREKYKLKEGSQLKIIPEDDRIVLKPFKSVADKYYGIYKLERWPEDLDKFSVEVLKKWSLRDM